MEVSITENLAIFPTAVLINTADEVAAIGTFFYTVARNLKFRGSLAEQGLSPGASTPLSPHGICGNTLCWVRLQDLLAVVTKGTLVMLG